MNNLKKGVFWHLFLCLSFIVNTYVIAAVPCKVDTIDEYSEVVYVYDGDTVKLKDGRKIRLIGIDTPEIGRKGKADQPYALKAKEQLIAYLKKNNNKVGLVFETQRADKYQRSLAHVFLSKNENVQEYLIKSGLAVAHTVPPNDRFSNCYFKQEILPRNKREGIWGHNKYAVRDSLTLKPGSEGYHIISGKVKKIEDTERGFKISVTGKVTINIKKSDLQYFNNLWLTSLAEKNIVIRGWLRSHKKGYSMNIRHPSSMIPGNF